MWYDAAGTSVSMKTAYSATLAHSRPFSLTITAARLRWWCWAVFYCFVNILYMWLYDRPTKRRAHKPLKNRAVAIDFGCLGDPQNGPISWDKKRRPPHRDRQSGHSLRVGGSCPGKWHFFQLQKLVPANLGFQSSLTRPSHRSGFVLCASLEMSVSMERSGPNWLPAMQSLDRCPDITKIATA